MDKSASTRRTIFRIINGFSRKLKSNKNRNITPQSKSKSRGLVERISRKECVGWYIAKDGNSPAPENFILAAEGKNWIESVTLFYRKDLSSINGENYYGFKIKFTGVLPKSATASLFYYRDNTIFHIPPAPAVKSPISKVSPKTLAINRFTAELISIDCEIKKPRLLNKLFTPEQSCITNEFSPALVQVGTQCNMGTAITGKDGQLFLYGGSNRVDSLYQTNAESVLDFESRWTALINQRATKLREAGIKFVQLCIPEKQSLYPEHYHRSIQGLTPGLAALEKTCPEGWFSTYHCLQKYKDEDIFFKTDSHLTALGSMRVFTDIIETLGLPPIPPLSPIKTGIMVGDLGKKFSPVMAEYGSKINAYNADLRKNVYKSKPRGGGHIGTEYIWHNENPICNESVMIFGNSFFAAGTSSHQLTWWFNQYFAKVHFIWAVSPDWRLIDKNKPTIVICQTIERFMKKVPKS